MARVVVIGGGWAGCAAAISAKKAGADVTLIERSDLLLGLGNVGGLMRNNGRFTAAEECIVLGGRELFDITDDNSRHTDVDFPGHKHASIYDVNFVESAVREKLMEMGIKILFKTTAVDAKMMGNRIVAIQLSTGKKIQGDSFVETTGSTGPINNCYKYGNGCAMCILRCPTFGGRVSIAGKCGVKERHGKRKDGTYGSFSGSVKVSKETLSDELQQKLDQDGVVIVPLPKEEINRHKLDIKVCRQYALDAFSENIILLDTGHAKLMAPFYPLERLRRIKGFEKVRFADPYSGGVGNSIRHFSIAPRDNYMRVEGLENLFVAGEKSGFYIGHTTAIVTGYLAGHNSVRYIAEKAYLELPHSLAIGDMIAYSNEKMHEPGGDTYKFTFAGADYFARMKARDLYTTDIPSIYERVNKTNLIHIYDKRLL